MVDNKKDKMFEQGTGIVNLKFFGEELKEADVDKQTEEIAKIVDKNAQNGK